MMVLRRNAGLDILKYSRLCEKIHKGTRHVEPNTLPPTSAAAMYHSLRLYYHNNVLERKRCQYEVGRVGIEHF